MEEQVQLVHWAAYQATPGGDKCVGSVLAPDSHGVAYNKAVWVLRCRVDYIRRDGLPPITCDQDPGVADDSA